jgi:hypothetical protein
VSVVLSVIVIVLVLKGCGILFPVCIANAQLRILISGHPMIKFFPTRGIVQ